MPAPDPLSRGELQHRALRGALWTGIHTIVSLPLAFGVNILVARILDVEGYGRLTYLTTVITIVTVVAGLGVTTALIQFGAKAHAAGRTDEVRRLLSGAQGYKLMVSGPLITLVVLALVRVEWWLMVIAIVFGIAASALLGGANQVLIIENRTDNSAQVAMIGNILVQAAIVITVVSVGTADAVWSARVIAGGLILVIPLLVISAQYRSATLRPKPPWTLPRQFWAFAIPTGVASIIGVLVGNRTEVVILSWFSDEYAMGLFGLAFGLAGHVYAPAQAFVGPLVPAISGLAEVDSGAVRRAFFRTTRAGCAIGGLVVVSALPALAILVPVIYGQRFAPASDMVVALGIGSALVLVGSPHMAFLMARLGGRRLLWVNVVSLIGNLVLAFSLIPVVGAWGAVIACAGGMAIRATQLTIGEARALHISTNELLRSLSPMLLAIIILVVLWFTIRNAELPALLLAPISAIAGTLAFIAAIHLARAGLTHDDTQAIIKALPRRLHTVSRVNLRLLQGVRDR